MTEGTAYRVAEQIMRERGLCETDYLIRYRHLRLDGAEKRQLKGENNLFILIDWNFYVKIKSKAGVYDMTDDGVNEQQHVHRGIVNLENLQQFRVDLRMLQVIPINKSNSDE